MNLALSGVGLGLRHCHFSDVLQLHPDVAWFELLIENYLCNQGPALTKLDKIRAHYPFTFHGVGLSLGSGEPLDEDYLRRLKVLVERFDPVWVSDHLCWSSVGGEYLNELLPLPLTSQTLDHLVDRVDQVQNWVQRPFLIENISSYLQFQHNTLSEVEFLNTLAKRSGCKILLDVNNIYVNAHNHGFDPRKYIDNIHAESVAEIHLAGHQQMDHLLVDTHSCPVIEPVWELYGTVLEKLGKVPTLIEWDNDIPEFAFLMTEVAIAQKYIY